METNANSGAPRCIIQSSQSRHTFQNFRLSPAVASLPLCQLGPCTPPTCTPFPIMDRENPEWASHEMSWVFISPDILHFPSSWLRESEPCYATLWSCHAIEACCPAMTHKASTENQLQKASGSQCISSAAESHAGLNGRNCSFVPAPALLWLHYPVITTITSIPIPWAMKPVSREPSAHTSELRPGSEDVLQPSWNTGNSPGLAITLLSQTTTSPSLATSCGAVEHSTSSQLAITICSTVTSMTSIVLCNLPHLCSVRRQVCFDLSIKRLPLGMLDTLVPHESVRFILRVKTQNVLQ